MSQYPLKDRTIYLRVQSADLAGLKRMVATGQVDVHKSYGESNWTVLEVVAGNRNLEAVKWLVTECQVNVDSANECGETPLFHAVHFGHSDIYMWLVKEGHANVNAVTPNGITLLHQAAYRGRFDLVQWLVIDKKVNIEIKDFRGDTALDIAKRRQHTDIVKLLSQQ